MNTILVSIFALCLFIASSNAGKDEFEKNLNECLKEFNTDMAAFKSGNVDKCLYKCLHVKKGMMTESGDLISVSDLKAKNKIPAEFIKIFEECVPSSKKDDACDTAKALGDCMKSKMPPKP